MGSHFGRLLVVAWGSIQANLSVRRTNGEFPMELMELGRGRNSFSIGSSEAVSIVALTRNVHPVDVDVASWAARREKGDTFRGRRLESVVRIPAVDWTGGRKRGGRTVSKPMLRKRKDDPRRRWRIRGRS